MSSAVYLVHGLGLEAPPLTLSVREQRDALASPPDALRYRLFHVQAETRLIVSALGGLLLIQRVGEAADAQGAVSFYDAKTFDPAYAQARALASSFVGRELDDFSFSFLWWSSADAGRVEWNLVELPEDECALLIEATLIWCLADAVDASIKRLPLVRAAGQVDRGFISQALDLFALERPDQVWTSQREIERIAQFYDAWGLDDRIARLRMRFDQAASGFSFFWEAAERRRESTLALALAVVAVVGLLQADEQITRTTGVPVLTVDWLILAVALSLVLLIAWRVVLAPRRAARASQATWKALRARLRDNSDPPRPTED